MLSAQYVKKSPDISRAAGSAVKSSVFSLPCAGLLNNPLADKAWRPLLSPVGDKGKTEDNALLKQIKEEKRLLRLHAAKSGNAEESMAELSSVTPIVGVNFIGNPYNGCPPDNSIAVSNGGYILSTVNSNLEYDDVTGNYLGGIDFVSFYNDPSISTNICDPHLLYDSGADRFLFITITCDGSSSTSRVLVCFSKTSNPADGWYYYNMPGNPLANGTWFDYPNVGVSNNEVYITGNLFTNGGAFSESIVYQIDKNTGYGGSSLTWQYWTFIPINQCQLRLYR